MIPYSVWADIDIANLAREQNLLSLLPVALYALCQCEINATELIPSSRRDDGTTTTLSPSNISACFAAWTTTLPKLQSETTLTWLDPASESWDLTCKKHWCNDIRKKATRRIFVPCVQFVGLCTWGEFRDDYMDPEDNMCHRYVSVAEQAHKDGRIKFWEGLPGAFGLPGWDELGKEREELS
ncbi:hypothetical protein FIBSPDRAFT_1056060 [Athelia psychrophila]|nr:hypothetical protein FIBSPDRAFT_1056060 [Fibularhizoctonia sp. CBS 109695]